MGLATRVVALAADVVATLEIDRQAPTASAGRDFSGAADDLGLALDDRVAASDAILADVVAAARAFVAIATDRNAVEH